MILYHTVSIYHILRSILHKMNYHKDEEAVILVPSFFPKNPFALMHPEFNEIFSKVISYTWEYKRYSKYPQDVFEEIEKCLKKELGDKFITHVSEFNVFYGARFFGSYLATKGIEFNWFEEADGRYINPYPPMNDDKRMYPERYLLANSLGLYTADNNYIKNIFVAKESNRGMEFNNRIIDFDVSTELRKLSDSQMKSLLRFWGISDSSIEIEPNSALLMSQHFCNIKLITFEEQVLLYQMTVDYFLPDYVIYVKLHPSDLFPYEEFISGVKLLDADYPSELLQYTCKNSFELVAAISSTGVRNLSNIARQSLVINEDYLKGFPNNDLYFFACQMVSKFTGLQIVMLGINELQMQAMISFGMKSNMKVDYVNDIEGELRDKIIVIGTDIDRGAYEKIYRASKVNCILVFLHISGEKYEMCLLKQLDKTVKKIEAYSIRQGKEKKLYEKTVFVLSDNKKNIGKVNSMEYEKLLNNTKVKVRVDKNLSNQEQIAVLTGMLDATEKALEHYVEENKILQKKLRIYEEEKHV